MKYYDPFVQYNQSTILGNLQPGDFWNFFNPHYLPNMNVSMHDGSVYFVYGINNITYHNSTVVFERSDGYYG